MKHRSKKPKPEDLRDEIEKHLRSEFDLVDGEIFVASGDGVEKTKLSFRADDAISACIFAIGSVDTGHGKTDIVKNGAGEPMTRPTDHKEPWTAEKYVHDLKLDRFLKEN